jgi:hypothetical protein
VALRVAKPAQWEFKSQPDLSSPHALWGWSATLLVRVEALSPELSIPPQKKKKLKKLKKLKNVNHASITHVML